MPSQIWHRLRRLHRADTLQQIKSQTGALRFHSPEHQSASSNRLDVYQGDNARFFYPR